MNCHLRQVAVSPYPQQSALQLCLHGISRSFLDVSAIGQKLQQSFLRSLYETLSEEFKHIRKVLCRRMVGSPFTKECLRVTTPRPLESPPPERSAYTIQRSPEDSRKTAAARRQCSITVASSSTPTFAIRQLIGHDLWLVDGTPFKPKIDPSKVVKERVHVPASSATGTRFPGLSSRCLIASAKSTLSPKRYCSVLNPSITAPEASGMRSRCLCSRRVEIMTLACGRLIKLGLTFKFTQLIDSVPRPTACSASIRPFVRFNSTKPVAPGRSPYVALHSQGA